MHLVTQKYCSSPKKCVCNETLSLCFQLGMSLLFSCRDSRQITHRLCEDLLGNKQYADGINPEELIYKTLVSLRFQEPSKPKTYINIS